MTSLYSQYDALVFDCDGTLVDSMPLHYQAWVATLERYHIPFPESRFYELAGVPTEGIVAALSEEHHQALDVQKLTEQKEAAFAERLESVTAIETIVAIARQHRGTLPMAVATGSPRWIATRELQAIGILDWFQALVSADDVAHHKPAPDTFLEAAQRLGIEPSRCCAFEDSDLGLQAIRAAGMTAVDIRPMLVEQVLG